jgi:hypothetical protein
MLGEDGSCGGATADPCGHQRHGDHHQAGGGVQESRTGTQITRLSEVLQSFKKTLMLTAKQDCGSIGKLCNE